MRPAQLRRFAQVEQESTEFKNSGFNEAGAAAPVCHFIAYRVDAVGDLASMRPAQLRRFALDDRYLADFEGRSFNEAGAAAPVCPTVLPEG